MGAQTSGFCSASPGQDAAMQMQITNVASMEGDKIDPWSNNLGLAADLPPDLLSVMTCGSSTAPPDNYLADSTHGSIVLTSMKEGPIFRGDVDSSQDEFVMALDPDTINQSVGEVTYDMLKR